MIDTFLLSCRVLGRGVEHRVMAALAEEATERGLAYLVARLEPTVKNQPAREFIDSIGQAYFVDGVYRFPVAYLRDLRARAAMTSGPCRRPSAKVSSDGPQAARTTRASHYIFRLPGRSTKR